jgi:hypothetical protein
MPRKPETRGYAHGFSKDAFPEDFGRHEYRKTNAVSENLNQNFELIVTDTDKIKAQILKKFDLGKENQEFSID